MGGPGIVEIACSLVLGARYNYWFHCLQATLISSGVTVVNVLLMMMNVMVLMTVLMVAMKMAVMVSIPSPPSLHLYVCSHTHGILDVILAFNLSSFSHSYQMLTWGQLLVALLLRFSSVWRVPSSSVLSSAVALVAVLQSLEVPPADDIPLEHSLPSLLLLQLP